MSKIAVSGPASGTATYTVTAPTGATDRVITLPDQTATLITDSAGVLNIGSGQLIKDASGNLGLGVTPSAWSSTYRAIQLPSSTYGGGSFLTDAGSPAIAANAYNNSGWKYVNNDFATIYQSRSGQHQWFTAASGTAGNAISFTQAMTLDASGNLGVGTTSPLIASGYTNLVVSNATNGGILYVDRPSGARGYFYANATTSVILGTAGSYPLVFNTADTERARIDSSGNLLVAKTSSSFSTLGAEMRATGQVLSAMSGSTNSTETLNVYSTGAAVQRFYVGLGGTVYATSTSISAISDSTLKENVRDLETGLSEVMALKPRRFDWKNGDAQNVAGFVAQEVEQVLPELVQDYVYRKDEENGDIIKKSLKMGDILPTMVKAIQEQQAIITALTARVAALESN